MTKKQYHHGNLRHQLLKTAANMIAQDGVENLTMRLLSREIGVSRTAAYRHFRDKNSLLCATAAQGFNKLTNWLREVNTDTSEDAFNRFQRIGLQYIEFSLKYPGYYRLMFGHTIIEQQRTDELHKAAQSTFSELIKSIEACQKENKIKNDDSLLVANTVWAWAHGLSMLLIDRQIDTTEHMQILPTLLTNDPTPEIDSFEKMIRRSMELMTHGIGKIKI